MEGRRVISKVEREEPMTTDTITFPAGLLEAIKPTIGRTVHYIMPGSGKHRPATVVEVFGDRPDGLCNLQVFVDGSNDGFRAEQGTHWAPSIHRDDTMTRQGTWHWPEGTREALSIAHVMRELTVYQQQQTRSETPLPPLLGGSPPTIKTEAVDISSLDTQPTASGTTTMPTVKAPTATKKR